MKVASRRGTYTRVVRKCDGQTAHQGSFSCCLVLAGEGQSSSIKYSHFLRKFIAGDLDGNGLIEFVIFLRKNIDFFQHLNHQRTMINADLICKQREDGMAIKPIACAVCKDLLQNESECKFILNYLCSRMYYGSKK